MQKKPVIAAIIVGFNPIEDVLDALVLSLLPQVDHLILVDNGGSQMVARKYVALQDHFHFVGLSQNYGLGYALNSGFDLAQRLQADYIATFDQDSLPPGDLIEAMLRVHLQLKNDQINCAAVGPAFYDRRAMSEIYHPFYRADRYSVKATMPNPDTATVIESDLLITSGMLVRADIWEQKTHYDEGLVVDYTDTEWCFRIRSYGYRIFGCSNIRMAHALSDAPPVTLMGLNFLHYSPLRRYYYFRNTVAFCKKNYVPWIWKLRMLVGCCVRIPVILVIDSAKFDSLRMMTMGLLDGLRGRSGKYPIKN